MRKSYKISLVIGLLFYIFAFAVFAEEESVKETFEEKSERLLKYFHEKKSSYQSKTIKTQEPLKKESISESDKSILNVLNKDSDPQISYNKEQKKIIDEKNEKAVKQKIVRKKRKHKKSIFRKKRKVKKLKKLKLSHKLGIGVLYGKYQPSGDITNTDNYESNIIKGVNLKYFINSKFALRASGTNWKQDPVNMNIDFAGINIKGNMSLKVEPYQLNLLYYIPTKKNTKPYFGFGIGQIYSEIYYADALIEESHKKTDSGWNAIAGIEHFFNKNISVFAEVNYLKCNTIFKIPDYSKDLNIKLDDTYFLFGLNIFFR